MLEPHVKFAIILRGLLSGLLLLFVWSHSHWSVALSITFCLIAGTSFSADSRKCPTCGSTRRNTRLVYLLPADVDSRVCIDSWHTEGL